VLFRSFNDTEFLQFWQTPFNLVAIQPSQFSGAIFAPCAETLKATHDQIEVLPSQVLRLICGLVAGDWVARPNPIKNASCIHVDS
jgi:hypothetical protein